MVVSNKVRQLFGLADIAWEVNKIFKPRFILCYTKKNVVFGYIIIIIMLLFLFLQFLESYFEIRSDAKHSEYCNLLERDDISGADRNHYSLVYGVNRRLSTLSFFNVASVALLPDIMHDILAGVLPMEVMQILKVILKYFNCLTFNITNLHLH